MMTRKMREAVRTELVECAEVRFEVCKRVAELTNAVDIVDVFRLDERIEEWNGDLDQITALFEAVIQGNVETVNDLVMWVDEERLETVTEHELNVHTMEMSDDVLDELEDRSVRLDWVIENELSDVLLNDRNKTEMFSYVEDGNICIKFDSIVKKYGIDYEEIEKEKNNGTVREYAESIVDLMRREIEEKEMTEFLRKDSVEQCVSWIFYQLNALAKEEEVYKVVYTDSKFGEAYTDYYYANSEMEVRDYIQSCVSDILQLVKVPTELVHIYNYDINKSIIENRMETK